MKRLAASMVLGLLAAFIVPATWALGRIVKWMAELEREPAR
jgi:hypothetical protein